MGTKMEEIYDSQKINVKLLPIFKEIKYLWHENSQEAEFVRAVSNCCEGSSIEMYYIDMDQYDDWIQSKKESLLKIITNFHNNDKTYKAPNPLFTSVLMGCKEVSKLLLKCGFDVNSLDDMNNTPLFYAVAKNQIDMAKLLLEHGATTEQNEFNMEYPSFRAVKNELSQMVQLLIKHKTDSTNTPLHIAAIAGHHEIIDILMNNGANSEATERKGLTPIHLAVGFKRYKALNVLIKNKANINAITPELSTPLHIAVRQDFKDGVQLLLKNGAEIESKDSLGCTPLIRAVFWNKKAIVELLLAYGANTEAKDNIWLLEKITWKLSRYCLKEGQISEEETFVMQRHFFWQCISNITP